MWMRLPDELLDEIISSSLVVSDEDFGCLSAVSPFATAAESSSAALLVCKSWLRVSTPLLYRVVILRSKPQLQALVASLDENPPLAALIKRLRLEGSSVYGPMLQRLVFRTKNITHLFISMAIWASESVSGLVYAFRNLQPTNMIVCDPMTRDSTYKGNRNLFKILEALIDILPSRTRLRTFVWAIEISPIMSRWQMPMTLEVIDALSRMPSLRAVFFTKMGWNSGVAQVMPVVLNPAVEVVYVDCAYDSGHFAWEMSYMHLSPSDRQKMVSTVRVNCSSYHERGRSGVVTSSRPTLMRRASEEERCKIWMIIIRFVLSADSPASVTLVCRKFHAMITALLMRKRFIQSPWKLGFFSRCMNTDRTIAQRLQTLYVLNRQPWACIENHAGWINDPQANADLCAVLNMTSRVRSVRVELWQPDELGSYDKSVVGLTINVESFNRMAYLSGTTLEEFHGIHVNTWGFPGITVNVHCFESFKALRSLFWSTQEVVTTQGKLAIQSDWLESLEHLDLREPHPSFIVFLNQLKLPNFHHLTLVRDNRRKGSRCLHKGTLPSAFAATHRGKIHSLRVDHTCPDNIFRCFPNVETVSVSYDWWQGGKVLSVNIWADKVMESFVGEGTSSLTLQKVQFRATTIEIKGVHNPVAYFAKVCDILVNFPQLREIQAFACVWPQLTDRAIKASVWPGIAADLLKQGVTLQNREGKGWKPRLGWS